MKNTQFLTYKYANGIVMTEEPFDEPPELRA